MHVISRPISMICWFEENGKPHPVRFKVKLDDETEVVIRIDKVLKIDVEKLAGNYMFVFKCQSIINSIQKIFEIKYEFSSCKWILWKM